MITGLYAGLGALMLLFLSARVVGARRRNKVSLGTGGVPDVERAMRVQANFVEYAPILLLMLALSELNGLPAIGVHILGAAIIATRALHYVGFSSQAGPAMARVVGAASTFGLLLTLGIIVILQSFGVLG